MIGGDRKNSSCAGVIDHFRAHVTLEDLHPREAYGRQAPEENDDNVQNTCERLAYLDNENAEAPEAIHQPQQPQKSNKPKEAYREKRSSKPGQGYVDNR
jgi:hypothetical protein